MINANHLIFGNKDNSNLLLWVYCLAAPIQVSIFESAIPKSLIISLIVSYFALLSLFLSKREKLQVEDVNVLKALLIPILVSSTFVLYNYVNLGFDPKYLDYIRSSFLTRLITSSLHIFLYFFFASKISAKANQQTLFNILLPYLLILYIIMLLGCWQLMHELFDVPFLSSNARTYVHSVGNRDLLFNFRLTSIFREPSFFVPFIVEFVLLNYLLCKSVYIKVGSTALGLLLLIFTFSGSMVIEIGFLAIGISFLLKKPTVRYSILLLLIVIIITVLFWSDELLKALIPITERAKNLTIYDNSRLYIWVMSFVYAFANGIIPFFVGHGPNSFKYLGNVEQYPMEFWKRPGEFIDTGTNNYFADAIYELGFVGFVAYIFLFGKQFSFYFARRYQNPIYLVGFLFVIHMLAVAFYRADYSAPHFFVNLLIVSVVMKVKIRTENGEDEKPRS